METATIAAMPASIGAPIARTVRALTDAPSSITATSSNCLAENWMPANHGPSGRQTVRTATPTRIASTSASK